MKIRQSVLRLLGFHTDKRWWWSKRITACLMASKFALGTLLGSEQFMLCFKIT